MERHENADGINLFNRISPNFRETGRYDLGDYRVDNSVKWNGTYKKMKVYYKGDLILNVTVVYEKNKTNYSVYYDQFAYDELKAFADGLN